MSASTWFGAFLVGGGLAFLVVGFLSRVYAREERLADILDLPYGETDVPLDAVIEQHSTLVDNLSQVAGRFVEQLDEKGSLATKLEQSRVPLRPGEYVVVVIAGGSVLGAFGWAITSQWFVGLVGVAFSVVLANAYLNRRITKRRKRFEEQFPDALSLIASSLSAGHTFLRAIQMMCEESEPPLAEEFARVVNETQLGDPVVDALDRMSQRLDVRDVEWVVQAIRIQQNVGGKLADLLHTLADFIRAREEIRREVDVLTAEGRISAWVLGALPVFLLVAISTLNPGYMNSMFQGWGFVWLAGSAISVAAGVMVIQRMVKLDV
ncbi:MAG TPA: type II secretion system F family protein [Acidimicrobiales bacterium]|nr:type II secretion system F family protein [Acidimicrobiales bacterium]